MGVGLFLNDSTKYNSIWLLSVSHTQNTPPLLPCRLNRHECIELLRAAGVSHGLRFAESSPLVLTLYHFFASGVLPIDSAMKCYSPDAEIVEMLDLGVDDYSPEHVT